MNRLTIPLSQRRGDIAIIAFFLVNILFITYIVDLEQLIILNASHFTYPFWPPHALVDLIHWWGRTFDPLIIARPAWWKATIWIDALFFGPFYVFAIYAYSKGKEWIRVPSIIYSSVMMTNVIIMLSEDSAAPTLRRTHKSCCLRICPSCFSPSTSSTACGAVPLHSAARYKSQRPNR